MEFDELARRLDEAYRSTAAKFPQSGVRIEKVKNKAGQELDALVLTGAGHASRNQRACDCCEAAWLDANR
jgi:uncharacterized heparinase superfamily protein